MSNPEDKLDEIIQALVDDVADLIDAGYAYDGVSQEEAKQAFLKLIAEEHEKSYEEGWRNALTSMKYQVEKGLSIVDDKELQASNEVDDE